MKRKLILAMFLCGMFCGTAVITHAYLTDHEQAVNELSVADNTIRIEEKYEPPEHVIPGTVITKAPRIVNDSEVSVYVRMSVRFSDSAAEAFCEPLAISKSWQYREDGYYYYTNALEPGQTSDALFEQVVIRKDVTEDELVPFDILVYAESVQVHETEEKDAWQYYTGGSV